MTVRFGKIKKLNLPLRQILEHVKYCVVYLQSISFQCGSSRLIVMVHFNTSVVQMIGIIWNVIYLLCEYMYALGRSIISRIFWCWWWYWGPEPVHMQGP